MTPPRSRSRRRASTRSRWSAWISPARAMIRTSQPGWYAGSIALSASRSLRRTRLRTTAVPSFRPVARPKRVDSRPVRRTRTESSGWDLTVPSRCSAAKSCGRVSITSRDRTGSRPLVRLSAACGRERAARPELAGHRSSSFEPGSRAPWRDVASWADRSASSGLRVILIQSASGTWSSPGGNRA